MDKYFLLGIALFSLSGSVANAGMVSGGGEVASDRQNPWFVENTKEVDYCISMDEANFGQTKEMARKSILAAFAYWKEEFSQAELYERRIPVGTQAFHEVSCASDHAITFQFGVLSGEQQAFLVDPSRVVGIAVRTDYDQKMLRGKGFVYISPENGPLALARPGLQAGRWSLASGRVLEGVLIHEIGHIFGIQHIGGGGEIMAASFPDELVTNPLAVYMQHWPMFFEHSKGVGVYSFCDSGVFSQLNNTVAESVLGLPHDAKCIKFEYDFIYHKIKLFTGDSFDAARSEIGVIELREGFGSANLVVSIFLTDKQQAFGNVPAKWVTGPVDLYATRSSRHVGTYTRADNVATRSIIVNSTASSLFLTAADADGNMLLDFIWGSSWGGFGAP